MPDSVVISLAAKSMEGVDAADPKVTVDVMETSPISRRVSRQIVQLQRPGDSQRADAGWISCLAGDRLLFQIRRGHRFLLPTARQSFS